MKTTKVKLKYTWAKALSDYLLLKQTELEIESYKTYKSKYTVFLSWLKENKLHNKHVSKLSFYDVANFFAYLSLERKISRKSLHEYKYLLNTTSRHFIKLGLLKINPFENLPKYKHQSRKPQIIPDAFLHTIKDYFLKQDKQMWTVCQFIFYCFIRPKELRFLKIKDIDFIGGYVTIDGDFAKNDKTQSVIIPDYFLDYLIMNEYHLKDKNDYLFVSKDSKNLQPVGRNYFSNQFRKMRKETKLTVDIKFYSFKHTGGVKLKKSGADLIEMKTQFRHYSIEQTYQYISSLENEDSSHIRKHGYIL